jgi:hypothetical protein
MSIGWQILMPTLLERYPRTQRLEGYDHFIRSGGSGASSKTSTRSPRRGWRYTSGAMARLSELVHLRSTTRPAHCNYSASLVGQRPGGAEDGEETPAEGVLGDMPIMPTHAYAVCAAWMCWLPSEGECPYDEGGYFIVDIVRRPRSPRARRPTARSL